jgi:hypothetical protein
MNRAQKQEHLAQAYRHIAELKSHILRQRVMLKHVLDTGQPSELAESMLHALEGSLRAFPQRPTSCPPATCGCMKSSTMASGLSHARMATACDSRTTTAGRWMFGTIAWAP